MVEGGVGDGGDEKKMDSASGGFSPFLSTRRALLGGRTVNIIFFSGGTTHPPWLVLRRPSKSFPSSLIFVVPAGSRIREIAPARRPLYPFRQAKPLGATRKALPLLPDQKEYQSGLFRISLMHDKVLTTNGQDNIVEREIWKKSSPKRALQGTRHRFVKQCMQVLQSLLE
ncbi:uncharacterized protein LOC101770395 [Setaria italica]|uniref:uncharacterized protein LOC101770395 n=1 Tax=Setaria italica TaxID=4555 RepID=UPI0006487CFE|nr:uncharacterized protein LOC101770395 [Setaria italica]